MLLGLHKIIVSLNKWEQKTNSLICNDTKSVIFD